MISKKQILITGGAGFIGSNLALELSKSYEVYCLDNFYKSESRNNIKALENENVSIIDCDLRDNNKVLEIIQQHNFDSIFHFGAQVAMTKSIEDPILDFETNVLGTLNILNSMIENKSKSKLINISSNKVYGDLSWDNLEEQQTRYNSIDFRDGYNEEINLEFSGPYGCSKGSAEQYVLDYKKTFGLDTISLRLSTVFGMNQFFTFDQGWIGWFVNEYIKFSNNEINEINILGNGKQVRDILFIEDLVNLFKKMVNKDFSSLSQNYFNVGGGIKNSISIIELLHFLSDYFQSSRKLKIRNNDWRVGDQKFYVSKLDNINKNFDWLPKVEMKDGIIKYLNWINSAKELN